MATFSSLLLVFLSLAIPFIEAHNGGFSVELIHRDSAKSPFYNPTKTRFQLLHSALQRSFNRFHLFYPLTKASSDTPQSQITDNQGEYLVNYSIGTPPFEIMGIFDTGSNLIWSQCKPCTHCYNQTNPMFDPSQSSTYKPIACDSRVCHLLADVSCDNADHSCKYSISYGDGSHSQGTLAFDTLTLGSTTGSSVAFPSIPIGCGFDNAGTFDNKTSGIVGVGSGNVSFISQIGPSVGFKFSYCLVPYFESNATSKLNFGDNAVLADPGVVSTPISPGDSTFYYLTLEAMSVGSQRIEFKDESTSKDKKGNIIIDSGTTLTFFPMDFYQKLESAVALNFNFERDDNQMLSLCYKAPLSAIQAPNITAHFVGADVALTSANTFVSISENITCFAFTSGPTPDAMFGNLAQVGYLVEYDLLKKMVSFKPTDCAKI
ncbi:aspartic proteinase CDR1-like [Abrus precatorius]|uniref:Aspartic proteinase CDR1-like n=1 Tax=Abrus precatorius TaxID=3816 RepID=A0A8B8KJJ3_ABRPR|nr:aspartic proteinase CDR1-like [Abrus precatorius]